MLKFKLETFIQNITLFNQYGEMVRCENNYEISVDDLPKGIYLVNIKTNNGLIQNRFIKE